MSEENSFLIFSGTKSMYLAEKICASLGCPLGKLVVTHFSDGEFAVSYEETVTWQRRVLSAEHVPQFRQSEWSYSL